MEHFKDNSGCSGKKKSEIFWNNCRKVQYVFAGDGIEIACHSIILYHRNVKEKSLGPMHHLNQVIRPDIVLVCCHPFL